MAGKINTTVYAIGVASELRSLAKVGKRRRKLAERQPVVPLTREQRVQRYANQSGWTAAFTPRQRRRLDHKEGRAKANYRGVPAGALATTTDEAA